MNPNARLFIATLATMGAVGSASLAGCSAPSREQVAKAAEDARAAVNKYCDARAKAIEALGTGEAGASP